MSTYTDEGRVTKVTAADLSQNRYYVAKTDGNDKLVLASASTDKVLGVIDDGGRKLGDSADVVLANGDGTFKVKLGGNVNKDDYLVSDGAGKAVAATQTAAGSQPTKHVFGQAVYAGNTGDVIEYYKKDLLF